MYKLIEECDFSSSHRLGGRWRLGHGLLLLVLLSACTSPAGKRDSVPIDSVKGSGAAVTGGQRASDGSTQLLQASISGDTSAVQLLVQQGADVNSRSNDGFTALMAAAAGGHPEMVSVLIAARADPNAKNPGGMTALMFATQTNQISAIKLLIEHGADVNARTPSGSSAIKYAAVMGRPGLVKLLIAMGAKKQDLKLLSPAAQEMLPLILKVNSREGSSSRELWQDVGERMEETLRMVKNPNVLLARQVIVLMAVSNFQSIFEKHPQLTHERLFEVACMFGNVVNVNAHYLMLHKDSQGGALIEKPGLDIDDTSANIPSN